MRVWRLFRGLMQSRSSTAYVLLLPLLLPQLQPSVLQRFQLLQLS
jgi:hypothetical protein